MHLLALITKSRCIVLDRRHTPVCKGAAEHHLLWRLRFFRAVPQLKLVGFAAVQRGEAGQQVDELAAWWRWRSGGLHLVSSPHGGSARRRHGVDHQRSPRRRVAKMPLAR